MPCAWLQFVLFVAVFSLVANGKLHSIQRFKRQTQLFGAHKPLVANDMPEPIGFGDLSRVLMDQQEVHRRLHHLASPPTPLQVSGAKSLFQNDDPGLPRSGQKQPFLFHVAQDFFAAAVNFLFNFMI